MPFASSAASGPTPPTPAALTDHGRAQEPTPQAAKKGRGPTAAASFMRRHEPASASSLSSAVSSRSASAAKPTARPLPPHHHPAHPHPRSLRLHVGVFSKRKGVRYNADGRVVKCRFCEILRDRDEPFLYEDELVVVFRPLHPIVPSHILIVPRAHIRNVNQLGGDHVALLRRMRAVADRVLHTHPELQGSATPQGTSDGDDAHHDEDHDVSHTKKHHAPRSPNDVSSADHGYPGYTVDELDDDDDETLMNAAAASDCRFAFHVPPFNSIDHVHMHAFRGETGYFGRIKYRTESWWCRSYDEVLARLELQLRPPPFPSQGLVEAPPPAAVTASSAPVVCTR